MFYDPSCKPELPPHRSLLLKAADLMEIRGHTKFELADSKGQVCFHGALYLADTGEADGLTSPLHLAASGHMRAFLLKSGVHPSIFSYDGVSCADWNNQKDLSGDDAVRTMRAAAHWDGPADAVATAKEEAALV